MQTMVFDNVSVRERSECMLKHFDNVLHIKCSVKKVAFEHNFDFTDVSDADIEALALAKAKIIFQDAVGRLADKAQMSVSDFLREKYAAEDTINMNDFVHDYGVQLSREAGLAPIEKAKKEIAKVTDRKQLLEMQKMLEAQLASMK